MAQSDLYSGYASGTFVPQVHTPLNMHVSNDSVSWTPNTLGNFGTGFEITEYSATEQMDNDISFDTKNPKA